MRILFVGFILLCAGAARAEDAKWPTSIIYGSGGILNPWKRTSVDLTTGILSKVDYSPNERGDALVPGPPAVRKLTSDQLRILRMLVDAVWSNGIEMERRPPPPCNSCSPTNATGEGIATETIEVKATTIQPECSIDSTGHFEIVKNGSVKTYDFLGSCYSSDTGKLINTLWCDANPDSSFCKTQQ